MKNLWMRSAVCALAVVMSVAASAAETSPSRKDVLKLAARVADWQLERMGKTEGVSSHAEETANSRSWQQGAFWVGMTRLADVTGEKRFAEAIIAMGKANQWQPGKRMLHADDHVIAQSYLWAARHGSGPEAIAPLRDLVRFDPCETSNRSPELRDHQGLRIDALPAPLVLV